MSAGGYLDGCGFIPASSGTGDFVVSTAVQGYQTPASAGAVNATVYTYRAESADKSQWEIGFGAYTTGTTTLARTTQLATSTGSKVSFSAAPNVYVTAAKADLQNAALLNSGTVPTARLGSGTASATTLLAGNSTWVQQSRVLLNTLTASNSPTLSDTTSFSTAGFSSFELVFTNIVQVSATAGTLELQVHSGGSFQTTGYHGTVINGGSSAVNDLNTTTFIPVSVSGAVQNTGAGFSGVMRVSNPLQTTSPKVWFGNGGSFGGSIFNTAIAAGEWDTGNGAVDGFQILVSSGNLSTGVLQVYGLI